MNDPHIKEPVGIDLNVGPMALSPEDRQTLSVVIAQYKLTKEVPKSKPKLAKTANRSLYAAVCKGANHHPK